MIWRNESGRHGRDRDREVADRGAVPAGATVLAASQMWIDARQLILVTLDHAGAAPQSRYWFVTLRPASGGRLLAGGVVDRAVERLLAGRVEMRAGGLDLPVDAMHELLAGALARTRAARMAVPRDLIEPLELAVPQSLRGDVSSLALLPDAGDDELVVSVLDDGTRLFALMDELLEEFERAMPEDPASSLWRSGDLVGGAMIEFKGRFADGFVGRWTVADLREFLLTWLPNTVDTDADVIADVPACVCAYLRFLSVRGSLAGDELAALEVAAASAAELLPARFASTAHSGIAADVARHRRAAR